MSIKPDLMTNVRWILCTIMAGYSVMGTAPLVCVAEQISLSGEFPQTVYLTSSNGEIRSGPSEDDYPTQLAERGSALEAYHRTQDGWLAIRPPSDSFSWVPASQAYLLPGGKVIEITDEAAVAWIGTELGTARNYRWQVQLKAGEQLQVLGEKSQVDANGQEELWYKIAPPDGEFRWIHEVDVSLSPMDAEPERIDDNGRARALGGPPATIASSSTANTRHSASLVADGDARRRPAPANQRRSRHPSGRSVETANYQDDVFVDAPSGSLVPVPQNRITTSVSAQPAPVSDRWDGWHAWGFDDDGMRLTILEKLMGGKSWAPRSDPQAADPFDLSMSAPVDRGISPEQGQLIREQQLAGGPINYLDPPHSTGVRQDRAWRDPQRLRQRRLKRAAEFDGLARTPPNIIQSIRENVESLRNSMGSTASSVASQDATQDWGSEEEWGQVDDFEIPPIRPFDGNSNAPSNKLVGTSESSAASSGADEPRWYGIGNTQSSTRPPGNRRESIETPSFTPPISDASSRELASLKVALSEMVARPPSLWNLSQLRDRTKHLIEHGGDPIERGQARLLLERIQEFETHAQRTAFAAPGVIRSSYQQQPATNGHLSPVTQASYQPATRSVPTTTTTTNPATQPYDATGWLVPVHATTPGQPSHALTDDSGHILAYVTSRAAMDLDSYINQPVGIIGLRGYLPRLQAGHIQAQRVVTLR